MNVKTLSIGLSAPTVKSDLINWVPTICAWMGNSIIDNGDRMLSALERLSGGRFVGKYNFGRAGITTLGMLNYIDADLAACPDAKVFFISEGSNDSTSFDIPAVYPRVVELVTKAKAAGKTVVLCASPPRYSPTNANVLPRTIDFCWMYYKIAKEMDCLFVDPWYDWRGTDGAYVAGYSTDNTHAAFTEMYELAAQRVWATIKPDGLPPTLEILSDGRSAGLSKVIPGRTDTIVDGNALVLAGASTQWVGAMSAGTANVVITAESATPFRGNQLKIDFSGGITGGTYTFSRTFSNNNSPNKPISSRVVAKAVVGTSNLVNAKVRVYVTGGQMFAATDIMQERRLDADREMYTTAEIPTTGNAATSKIVVEVIPTTGTATGVVTISNADIYNMLAFGGA
jgi:hypothetical protein